tara:strand:- start:2621 stop:3055 length:435 start_codon:yes stop_codon:yes gene_type:complete
MRHFTLPVFAAALILANPVLAQDNRPESEMVERLNDPAFQDNLVSMMTGFMAAMMDLPIGQLAGVMGNAIPKDMRRDGDFAHIDPDATLGDFARRDDPDFDRDMEDRMRTGSAMMGIMATEFEALLPRLQAIGEKMTRQMETTR